ncbi:ATP synthase subunit I [Desulfobulbus oligotrophicus]|jgi:F1F0 ATPase subunit 2|uniref:ATP synthase subunit I n=1 Tax=Desulfobulbus oligotrophicus TaxID=1909699 RepID=A0A7T5VBR2_9BACT|nr:ATP synthase subunit I [Desulfobulbus oligotrophicus]MCB5285383.1 ATP synthase subunit I [Candidatus Cloacimonadota bacterium]MDY0367420.1 ATP synthase subunit I [Candidatus Syntrophosphaera sp.]QQG64856.1 ATP synthase subunit I [Desulfobulbus oligotrophicus]
MNTALLLLLALVAGLGLGLLYFGGLWLTVQRLARTRNPTLLFALSFVLRTALVVTGMYLVMDGSWQRLLVCLAGFIIVRQVMLSRLRPDCFPQAPCKGVEP